MKTSTVGKNVSSSTPQANPVIPDRACAKTRCQGIRQLYIGFVKSHLKPYCKKGKKVEVEKISRQKIELQLFEEIDKWDFPIEYKMSWYHEVSIYPHYL